MNGQKVGSLRLNRERFEAFKKLYQDALNNHDLEFAYDGQTFDLAMASHIIEYATPLIEQGYHAPAGERQFKDGWVVGHI